MDDKDQTKSEIIQGPKDPLQEPRGNRSGERNGPDEVSGGGMPEDWATRAHAPLDPDFAVGTQSLDLSGLFTKHVNTTGSFQARGVGSTLLGKVLEALPIPAILLDRATRVTFGNQACRRIDKQYHDMIGKPFIDLFGDRSAAERVHFVVESVFATRKPRYLVALLRINEGSIWGRITLRSVRIGKDRFLLALVEDLTAEHRQLLLKQEYNIRLKEEMTRRELAEQTRRQSDERFQLAMKGADLAWWDWTLETGALFCDRSFSEMLGYAADEIPPKKHSWQELVHPEDVPRFSAVLKTHFDQMTPVFEVEHRVRTKSGAWKWVMTRGRVLERDTGGKPVRASGTNLDITNVKEAQERIDALTHALIKAQERERERISLDLHDQVAQDLAALRIALQGLAEEVRAVKPELSDRAGEISETVKNILRDVRDLSYELRPPGLDELGLARTIEHYCREFSTKHRLEVQFVSEGIDPLQLDFDTEINLFRVFQEALNNVAKHAKARNVIVRLTGSRSGIVLTIQDDGVGFDVNSAAAAAIVDKRMGLWCMEQRLGLLRGRIDVVSKPGSGTEIVVVVPLGEVENGGQEEGPHRR